VNNNTKSNIVRIVILISITYIIIQAPIAHSDISTDPIPPYLLWTFDINDVVLYAEWSSDNKLAVITINNIIVYDKNGIILLNYSNKDIKYIYDVEWSPDGRFLAVAAGEVGVFVFDICCGNGTVAWNSEVVATSLSWDPINNFIIVAGSDIINLYTLEGLLLWNLSLGSAITDIEWSPTGSSIAVGTISKGLFIINKDGIIQGKYNIGPTQTIQWSPNGSLIAIKSTNYNIIIYNIIDKILVWEFASQSPISHLSWNANGDALIISTLDNGTYIYLVDENKLRELTASIAKCSFWGYDKNTILIISLSNFEIYSVEGVLVWNYTLDKPQITKCSISKTGEYIGLVIGDKIYLYSLNITFLLLSPPENNVQITIIGGDEELSINLDNDQLIYANSGNYSIIIHYNDIGNPIVRQVQTELFYIHNISIPSKYSTVGELTISGYPGTVVEITWEGDGRLEVIIPDSGVLTYSATPGKYVIKSKFIPEIGEEIVSSGEYYVLVGDIIKVELPEPGFLRIESPTGSTTNITWHSGYVITHVQGIREFTASPSSYRIYYILDIPNNIIYIGSRPTGTEEIIIKESKTSTINIPSWYEASGRIVIKGPNGTRINITWNDGHTSIQLERGKLELFASPGVYSITGFYNYDVGPQQWVGSIQVVQGSDILFKIPLPGYLVLSGPSGTDAIISWNNISKRYKILDNEILLEVVPGSYQVSLYYESFFKKGKITKQIVINESEEIEVYLSNEYLELTTKAKLLIIIIIVSIILLLIYYAYFVPRIKIDKVKIFVLPGSYIIRFLVKNPTFRPWRGKISINYENKELSRDIEVRPRTSMTIDMYYEREK